MIPFIDTRRLHLIPLTLEQLELSLQKLDSLEEEINMSISRSFMTERVNHAIRMKIDRMRDAEISQHDWFTYWLIVIREQNMGAGMLGFKGFPDERGATEIGYGIAPEVQGMGYMTEAVQGLIQWAFTHPFCQIITATEVENPPSRRILEKLGAQLVHETDHVTSWEIRRLG